MPRGVQMRTTTFALLALAIALLVAGCGGSTATKVAPAPVAAAPKCPVHWVAGWTKLAKRLHAPIYCPSWMPSPLDAEIGGDWFNGVNVSPERAYLVSFVWQDTTLLGGQEVHVNFRGYPGHTAIPICEDTLVTGGKIVHPKMPCFSDAHSHRPYKGSIVTMYTTNQGVDTWHVLYAWRRFNSLYTISEHVVPPYTYSQVIKNLDRILASLVLIRG